MDKSRVFEYPPGSGRRARYDDHEVELMQAFVASLEAGRITKAEFTAQVRLIHDAKMLGYRIAR